MKKLIFILSFVLILVSLTGCTKNVVSDASKSETTKDIQKEELTILGDYGKALKLLDSQLNSGVDERININEGIGVVEIQKIDDKYYLGSYYNYPRLPMTNLYYSIIDLDENIIKPIEKLEYTDYIEEVYVDMEDMSIRFIYNGINIIDGYRQYPYDLVYDIKTGEYRKENEYTKIDMYSRATLGNEINIIGFNSVEAENKEIKFDFIEVEGTILAGGNLCPTINMGRKLDNQRNMADKEPVKLYIDFKNTALTGKSKEQILALKNMDYINNVEIREYLDVNENNHVVVYLTVEGINEYKGETNMNEKTGLDDFKLILR